MYEFYIENVLGSESKIQCFVRHADCYENRIVAWRIAKSNNFIYIFFQFDDIYIFCGSFIDFFL